jgi:hypothetical protein
VGCDRLPKKCHGKEGVDGSSPSEGLFGNEDRVGEVGVPDPDTAFAVAERFIRHDQQADAADERKRRTPV